VKEDEYGGSIYISMYENGTMRPAETVLKRTERG
jgi:hypothetical protein